MTTTFFRRAVAFTILLLTLFLFVSPAFAQGVDYSDYDYYFSDYHVEVVANSDRSFDITETIVTYFNLESRGIFRNIPKFSSVEEYSITDIDVVGDPFTVEDRGNFMNIRIGDPDIYLTKEKTDRKSTRLNSSH